MWAVGRAAFVRKEHGSWTGFRWHVGEAMTRPLGARGDPLWLVDWSDEEDHQFRAAWRAAGISARVLRARPLGPTVGTAFHWLRSWPTYLWLAERGLREASTDAIVAWQPLAGAVAGLLRRRRAQRLLILNPILQEGDSTARQRMILSGLQRADSIVMYSRSARKMGVELGLDPGKLRYVPLGVNARRQRASRPGTYFLAAGQDYRDWATLAEAVTPLDVVVKVAGLPTRSHADTLQMVHPKDHRAFLDLLEGAAALVVPLQGGDRQAGQLAILDAMSLGRAVIATRGMGTEDYVTPKTGILVPPRDPVALREAIVALRDPELARIMGEAALTAAQKTFSLERFVRTIDAEARSGPPVKGSTES
jgi:glycosyltransferase involved in cell wall biosynthesis